jgi:hypothetical protein
VNASPAAVTSLTSESSGTDGLAGDGEADDFLRAVQSQYESLENMGLAISDIRLDVLLFYREGALAVATPQVG